MNIEQLEYVVEVAKTKSISIASENLKISQSGISRSISNLENELGMKLFNRSKSGTLLTEDGEKIVKIAFEIVSKLQLLKEEAQEITTNIHGKLKISSSPSVMTLLLKVIPLFKKDYPGVKLEITEQPENEIIDDIRNNRIDIGLVYINENIQNSNDLKYGTLVSGKLNVCVNKNSPLSLHHTLSPTEILDQPLAMFNGVNMKKFIEQFFNDYGEMEVLFMSNNSETVKRAVVDGIAITFIIDLALNDDIYVKNGSIVLIPLIDCGFTTIPFGWIRLNNQYFSYLEREFIKYLQIVSADY
ncbi:LysR family transcriptional activator of glutamate synthase operon [Neobacillus niacini]|uniref:LysR family transcriptional regulator n=1 Tax=Neobacillus driksii TaxID=3035913 RepID=UPI0027841DED|nr:LysR family transcriptional regulator [Neobacillus niacini]MDQ0971605.1 LysR family transcriptional activator of glutamate synthase operon [Neobacillus niacini]